MTDFESTTHIVIALINNGKIENAKEAGEAYKEIIKVISNPND